MIHRPSRTRTFRYGRALAAGLLLAAALSSAGATAPASAVQQSNRYSSGHVGLAFDYPPGYSADLSHENDGTHQWHMVTVHKAQMPAGTSTTAGAPRITICVFENERKWSPREWIHSSERALPSASPIVEGNLGADPSVSYDDSSGVHHLALLHDGLIYYFSVYSQGDGALAQVFKNLTATIAYPTDGP